ncbi:MAG: leucyl/phenylalanyl-tRNA---protein transferase [Actinomycetota bacterium]|jgi:leucyl/phenylalanyl-tRNA--protein transferase|nr:leucyl/phenylalanyl-tRNA---protein transferase [Actinomycetota bacterium]
MLSYGGRVSAPAELFEHLDVRGARRALVALGGTLEPGMLIAAYRAGCFPWPSSGEDEKPLERQARRLARRGEVPLWPGEDGLVPWCSPDPRAILLADSVVVSRSLRRTLRRSGWHTTVDAAFDDVVAGCAAPAPGREGTWITERMRAAYGDLHRLGGAHSVEVWDGERLIGGLYGVLTGQVFSGESMFHLVPDASKVALVDLCSRLLSAGVVLLDTQQPTEHMASMGQIVVHRSEYLEVLASLRDRPAAIPAGRRAVVDLA